MTKDLTITSCQAANTFDMTEQIGDFLATQLAKKWGLTIRYVTADGSDAPAWHRLYDRATAGEIDISWVCAASYAQLMHLSDRQVDLLATPIFCDPVYQNEPIYFSYLLVPVDSLYQEFADLQEKTFIYNETVSHSGHNIVCAQLQTLGFETGYFSTAVVSGGHVNSIEMLAAGKGDCAAIDSSVWLWYQTARPEIAQKLRSIALLGPYAAPPWIINRRVPDELAQEIRSLLLDLHRTDAGTALLNAGGLCRFTTLANAQYEPALHALQMGKSIPLVKS